jgi:hypothetical protein
VPTSSAESTTQNDEAVRQTFPNSHSLQPFGTSTPCPEFNLIFPARKIPRCGFQNFQSFRTVLPFYPFCRAVMSPAACSPRFLTASSPQSHKWRTTAVPPPFRDRKIPKIFPLNHSASRLLLLPILHSYTPPQP